MISAKMRILNISRSDKCCTVIRRMVGNVQAQENTTVQKTALYELHERLGGRLVPFAGYLLPVQYGSHGIAASHLHTRLHVGLFDVSHMLQSKIEGRDRIAFIESLTVADIDGLQEGQGCLSVLTNDKGGIIDDLIISKTREGYLYLVSNAGCRDKDITHLKSKLQKFKMNGGDADMKIIDDYALLALQGPGSVKVLQPLVSVDLSSLFFMKTIETAIAGMTCRLTRCGYTGEDGFEISVHNKHAIQLAEMLLNSREDDVKAAGLGARDSLRLEAGLCLYGNDINEQTTPVEASLTWLLGKRRRSKANFPGADVILEQLKTKPSQKRVGFLSQGPPARAHSKIFDANGKNVIGEVTSGCPSPTLQQNVAMGYVSTKSAKVGSTVMFEIRNKMHAATVAKMPFVPHQYFTGKK